MAAIGGIDIALWDIKGKVASIPVYKLLGGSRQSVFTYSTGGYYVESAPLEAVADELAAYVEMGYKAVKMKTGALGLRDEQTRIRAVRDAIGTNELLKLDMNAPYGIEDCIEFAHAVAPYDILLIAPHTASQIHGHLVSAFGATAFGAEFLGGHERHPVQCHLYTKSFEMHDGMVHLSGDPGFGVEIDWTYVETARC
jgi:L-alanine-DL-glutamate epimerase-like enolase superfamily enzyme